MQNRRGFTIIELVVVMVIMAILLTLSVISINNSQANARNSQRNTDVEIIARGLEQRYKQGNDKVSVDSTKGSYPTVDEMRHILGATIMYMTPDTVQGGYPADALPGTVIKNFTPPGATSTDSFITPACTGIEFNCPVVDTAATGSTTSNSVTIGQYYYEPITRDNTICMFQTGDCVRYNLYWRTETDNVKHIIRSTHQ